MTCDASTFVDLAAVFVIVALFFFLLWFLLGLDRERWM